MKDAELIPVCDYFAFDSEGSSNGRVYAALIRHLGELPPNEMSKIEMFDALPDHLTYPFVTPVLFAEAQRKIAGIDPAAANDEERFASKP